jgi:dCTP diphosphatase
MEEDTRDNSLEASRLVQVRELAEILSEFAEERNWKQYHSPKNLVMALAGEVGELSEIFQWMTEDASKGASSDPSCAQAIKDELADVLIYLVRLSDVLDVDLNAAVLHKLKINASKYPVSKARGTSKKYTEI